jgi:crotonobetainyl-CoA:carnitine CoA-transferase CaiB-like acyl-CoA transferase
MSAGMAVAGALTALLHKRKTGEGQMVDMATYDAISSWQAFSLVWGFTFDKPRVRVGNFDWCMFPYGYYEAKDGYVTVVAPVDADFRGLLKILGRWDLENDWRFIFDRITDDVEKLKVLEAELKKEFLKYTRRELLDKTLAFSAKAARDKLRGKGFPIVVETRSPREVLGEEHWKIRKSFLEIDTAKNGRIKIPSPVPKMSESPPRVKNLECAIGQDNDDIYQKYGLTK